jgi:hypothetical protein
MVLTGHDRQKASTYRGVLWAACELTRKRYELVLNQATSRGMDRCSLCGQPKARLEFLWTLL